MDRDDSESNHIVGSSGWLYADLLIVLFIAGLSLIPANTTSPSIKLATTIVPTIVKIATTFPTSTAVRINEIVNTSPTPVINATSTPIIGLSQIPIAFTVTSNASQLLTPQNKAEREHIREQIKQLIESGIIPPNARAGLVLTFGNSNSLSEGQNLARIFNELLKESFPEIFGDAATRDLGWVRPSTRGQLDVEVYIFAAK